MTTEKSLVRHGGLIVVCAVLALLVGLGMMLRTPPTYLASASVQLETRGSAADDANAAATAIAVLTSRSLAREVADSLGDRLGVDPAVRASRVRANATATQPDPRASVLVVAWRGTDPQLATDVANLLASAYVRRSTATDDMHRGAHTHALQHQVALLAAEARERDRATDAYVRRNSTFVPGAEGTRTSAELDRLAELRAATVDDRDLLAATLNSISQDTTADDAGDVERLFSTAAFMRAQNAIGSAAALQARLHAQQDRRAELLTRLDRHDPDVASVERQIAATRRDVRAVAEGYVAGLSDQVRRYDGRIGAIRRGAEGLPAQQNELARLQRQQQRAEDLVARMRERLSDASIVAVTEAPSAQLLDVAEAAIAPPEPSRAVVLTLWLVAGLGVGCGAAVVRDRFEPVPVRSEASRGARWLEPERAQRTQRTSTAKV